MRAAEAGEGLAVCLSLHVFVSLISLVFHSCLSVKSFCVSLGEACSFCLLFSLSVSTFHLWIYLRAY